MLRPLRISVLSAVVFASVCLLASCESDPDEAAPPFSAECDECLSRGACAPAWDACIADTACDEHALCVLREQCYTRPVGSACARDAGCELPADAGEAALLAQDFETCARTECASLCGFREP